MSADIEYKLKNMPLEEKVAQLMGIRLTELMEGDCVSLKKCREQIPHGIGHICQFGSSADLEPKKLAKAILDVQNYVMQETQSKIPVLPHDEAINGVATKGATITPQMIGMSCSWNPQLVYENAKMAAQNMMKLGAPYALSPMMDVITDARWGRGEEGYGEEAHLVSLFALAFIKGLQSEGVSATAKHFAGYGVENQEEVFFRNETLMPFEIAIKQGHVKAIMPGYHQLGKVPCSSSEKLLQHYLRDVLGFHGVVVADYGAIYNTMETYGYVSSVEEAALMSLKAGIDVDFPTGTCYITLVEAVRSGKISEALVDQSVSRVLALKEDLGVLHAGMQIQDEVDLDPIAYRKQALISARESIVLLKNNGVLPLQSSVKKIAVVGPNADSYYSLLGDYTWVGLAEYFHRLKGDKESPKLITLLDGLKAQKTLNAEISYERGCNWDNQMTEVKDTIGGDERGKGEKYPLEQHLPVDYKKAMEMAQESDVIIAAMGENRYLCGECCNREDVRLPGEQEEFLYELCKIGKPVIMVVFGGRPMAIAALSEKCAAVLYAWYPGEEGGTAVTEILVGETNPCGKLTVSLPDTTNDVPINYQMYPVEREAPKFPFGYGISYAHFQYDSLAMPETVSIDETFFDICFHVHNNGNMDGIEIAQVYYKQVDALKQKSRRLLGFCRVDVKKGEGKSCRLRIYLEQFARYDKDGALILQPDKWEIEVGDSSVHIFDSRIMEIVGESKVLPEHKEYFAKQLS